MTSESGVAQCTRAAAKYCYYSKRAARGQFNHRTTAMVTCCISRSRSLLRSRELGSLALPWKVAGGRPYERRRGCGARPGESEAPYPEYKWYSIK